MTAGIEDQSQLTTTQTSVIQHGRPEYVQVRHVTDSDRPPVILASRQRTGNRPSDWYPLDAATSSSTDVQEQTWRDPPEWRLKVADKVMSANR